MLHTSSTIRSAVNVSIAKTTRLPKNTGAVWRIIESPSCVKNTTKLAELNGINENPPSTTSKHLSDIVEQLFSFYRPGRQHQVMITIVHVHVNGRITCNNGSNWSSRFSSLG